MKETLIILCILINGLVSGIGLISIYDEMRDTKRTCFQIQMEQQETEKELNKLKKEMSVNTEVCYQIVNKKW